MILYCVLGRHETSSRNLPVSFMMKLLVSGGVLPDLSLKPLHVARPANKTPISTEHLCWHRLHILTKQNRNFEEPPFNRHALASRLVRTSGGSH